MNIKTKFEVNDLVRIKYEVPPENTMQVLVIKEITTNTCSSATQVFYLGRLIILIKKYEKQSMYKGKFSEDKFNWVIGHATIPDNSSLGWKKYREDELLEADKKTIDVLKKYE